MSKGRGTQARQAGKIARALRGYDLSLSEYQIEELAMAMAHEPSILRALVHLVREVRTDLRRDNPSLE